MHAGFLLYVRVVDRRYDTADHAIAAVAARHNPRVAHGSPRAVIYIEDAGRKFNPYGKSDATRGQFAPKIIARRDKQHFLFVSIAPSSP
jgi:hypothetical protein